MLQVTPLKLYPPSPDTINGIICKSVELSVTFELKTTFFFKHFAVSFVIFAYFCLIVYFRGHPCFKFYSWLAPYGKTVRRWRAEAEPGQERRQMEMLNREITTQKF